jgi:RNA polymerase primary sigma factor
VPIGDGVGLYFAQIGQVPLLTRGEEIGLALLVERGREAEELLSRDGRDPVEAARLSEVIRQGRDAREYMILANTRLVVSVAKRYQGMGMPLLDLVQAGNLGLIKAVGRYDYRRGTRLSTVATWWIRQAVTRSLSKHARTIRLPVQFAGQLRRLSRVSQELAQSLGREPTPEEIAEADDKLTPEKVRWLLRASRTPLSLDKPIGEENDDELGSLIEDVTSAAPDDACAREFLRGDLAAILQELPPREARALRMRYGLDGGRPLSLKEIGGRMGVTRERARQIVVRALRRLRHPRHSRQLQRYLT